MGQKTVRKVIEKYVSGAIYFWLRNKGLGPLRFVKFNSSAIWALHPWVSIQINFCGSLLSTTVVLHTCKILNYFYLPIYFWQGGPNCQGMVCTKWARGGEQISWGKRDGARGWSKGGNRGGMYILMKFSVKQLEH